MRVVVSLLVLSAVVNLVLLLALWAATRRLRDGALGMMNVTLSPSSLARGDTQLMLVVEPRCIGCHDRLAELAQYVNRHASLVEHVTVVSPESSSDLECFALASGVSVVISARLPAELRCTALPELVLLSATGEVIWRRIAGSPDVLAAAVAQLQSYRKVVRT